jgi:DNA mismatch repair protein MutS
VKDGPANQSYGLQVAALAGVPPKVIGAARRYLHELERRSAATHGPRPQQELALEFAAPTDHAAVSALRTLDPDAMTPRDALEALYKLKQLTGN